MVAVGLAAARLNALEKIAREWTLAAIFVLRLSLIDPVFFLMDRKQTLITVSVSNFGKETQPSVSTPASFGILTALAAALLSSSVRGRK